MEDEQYYQASSAGTISTDYSPEDDINTVNKMPCDIVKIVFWITFYKVEYKLNFSCFTLVFVSLLAFATLSFQFYACWEYLRQMTKAQSLEASEQPPWIIHWLGIIVLFTELQHTVKENLDAFLPSFATIGQKNGKMMYIALLLAAMQILESFFMELVAYYVIVSCTNVADVFKSGAALLLIQQIDNCIGQIACLLIKPYGEFLLIKEKDINLARLYCVYTSAYTLSQFVFMMSFAIAAYVYDPTHKLMLAHWLPYATILLVWILSIFLIDIYVALRYKNGKEMFDKMLAGFVIRPDSLIGNSSSVNHLETYDKELLEGGFMEPKSIKTSVKHQVQNLTSEIENLKNENYFLKEKNRTHDSKEMAMEKKFADLQSQFVQQSQDQNLKIQELMNLVKKTE